MAKTGSGTLSTLVVKIALVVVAVTCHSRVNAHLHCGHDRRLYQ
jgi:hypothetical protein